ncbi:hypothetical protein GJ744_011021 [Endocarpon pusillum]|uniref:Yeast cell wall synthesis Kre9/Knh1 C-terminal domain-containing protein n=1 Tax=Endocarpon pusillum TaxID=364733 RepID=A0A8H7E2I3_9EURO|nr:hypothetical protein GJ744_011021 [Endocarpon pusillum]
MGSALAPATCTRRHRQKYSAMWIIFALLCTAHIASIARAAATDDFTVVTIPPTLTTIMESDGVLSKGSTTIEGLRLLTDSSEKTTATTAVSYTFSCEVSSSAALRSRSMLQPQPDTSYILSSISLCSSSLETASSTPPTPETYPSSSRNSKTGPAAVLKLDVDTSPAATVTQPAAESRFEQVTGLPIIHKTVTVTVSPCTNRTVFNITALYQSATFDTTVLNTHDRSSPTTGIPHTGLLSSSMILSPHPFSGTLAPASSSNLTFMPPSTTALTVMMSTHPSPLSNLSLTPSSGYSMAPVLETTLSTQLPIAITTPSYSNLIPEAEEGPSYPDSLTSMVHESAQTNVVPVKKPALHSPSSILVHASKNPSSSNRTAPKEQALTATTPTSTAEDVQRRSLPGLFGAPPANPAPTLNSPIQNVIVTVKNTAAATGAWLSGAMWRFFEETGNRRGLAEADLRVGAGT